MTVMQPKNTEDILHDLIAMPTVTGDYEAIHEAFDYIEAFLEPYKLHIKRFNWNGVESLLATTHQTQTPQVMFGAHLDVVPGIPEQFRLRKADGKYLGRGVQDMKGAIAAFLSVIAELGSDLPHYDLGLMITSDEEVGGYNGTARLVRAGYVPKVLILPDGGNNWDLEKFAKGIWHFNLEAKGTSAHASRPWEGDNAIDKLLTAMHGIRALFPTEPSSETNTINFGNIHGGNAINQIAAHVSVGIDMRFVNPAEQKRVITAVTQITKAQNLQLNSVAKAEPLVNDTNNRYLKLYIQTTEEITGKVPSWIISNGASDARFFANKDTVCIVSYPPGGNLHGHGEWITQESLGHMHSLFLAYLQKVSKVAAKEKSTAAV